MKRKNNLLKIITLVSVITFVSCQKNENIVPDANGSGQKLGVGVITPPISNNFTIPLAGNAYVTNPVSGGTESITSTGLENWSNSSAVVSTFFRLGLTGPLTVSIRAKVPTGTSTVSVSVNGTPFTVTLSGNAYKNYIVGTVDITKVGYVKVDLKGITKDAGSASFASVSDLIVTGAAVVSNVVFANDIISFSSARKGVALNLQYTVPTATATEWFYSEMSIPTFGDRAGTVFNCQVFDGGSVGLEVTASGEKRITFSVENPIVGSNTLMRKGNGVSDNIISTGVSSFLVYNWANLTNYKFLTQGKPDGTGNTVYTSWFLSPETSEWTLIASWKKPYTSSYLFNLNSSVESTISENSYLARAVRYSNQWVKDINGNWSEITQAKLTGNSVAGNSQRQDYSATVVSGSFYLRNNGFLSDFTALNTMLNKPASSVQPTIDFTSLP